MLLNSIFKPSTKTQLAGTWPCNRLQFKCLLSNAEYLSSIHIHSNVYVIFYPKLYSLGYISVADSTGNIKLKNAEI